IMRERGCNLVLACVREIRNRALVCEEKRVDRDLSRTYRVTAQGSKHILERVGEHTQAGRWVKFTSLREIAALRSTLKDYLYEAIELEESGKKIELKKPSEYPLPEEMHRR